MLSVKFSLFKYYLVPGNPIWGISSSRNAPRAGTRVRIDMAMTGRWAGSVISDGAAWLRPGVFVFE
jgi:hypothetical protein